MVCQNRMIGEEVQRIGIQQQRQLALNRSAQQRQCGIELAGKSVATLDPQAQLVASYRRKLSMALN